MTSEDTIRFLQETIANLTAKVEALESRIKELGEVVAVKDSKIEKLEQKIAELEEKNGKTPRNSSKPPSSEPPWMPRKKNKPTGKKKGGQPGHEGHSRKPLPEDQVDEFHQIEPDSCKGCGHVFSGKEKSDGEPFIQQRVELPEKLFHLTQFEYHTLECPCCGENTRADIPSDESQMLFGPRMSAFIGMMTSRFRVSRREACKVLEEVFKIKVAVGTISKLERRLVKVTFEEYQAIQKAVLREKAVGIDETSWSEKQWLWVVRSAMYSFFAICPGRSSEDLLSIIGDYDGYVISDRYSSYNVIDQDKRQSCNSHIKRDLEAILDRGRKHKKIAEKLIALKDEIFFEWRRFKAGEISRKTLQDLTALPIEMFEARLEAGGNQNLEKSSGTLKKLNEMRDTIWRFIFIDFLDSTNNGSERDIRKFVLWRKCSFGSRSEIGAKFAVQMMSFFETAKKQGLDAFDRLATMFARLYNLPILSGNPALAP